MLWNKTSLTDAIISGLDSLNEVNNYAYILLQTSTENNNNFKNQSSTKKKKDKHIQWRKSLKAEQAQALPQLVHDSGSTLWCVCDRISLKCTQK